ncbi:Transmembrane nucleoporin [Basidiobolus ranarum]|uniref:Transmembrane nucleoporin n=1 Tax=Basidiobolus ranarum TaxID=34480 RepID=A0ABR2VSB8_9FUNG
MSSRPQPPASLVERIKPLVMNPRFAWWIGHCIVTISTFFYFYNKVFGSAASAQSWYSKIYIGVLISYGITVWKTYGVPQFNSAFLQRVFMDDNVHYMLMGLLWYISPSLFVTVIPFAVYSLFHVIDFARVTLLPTIFPDINSTTRSAGGSQAANLAKGMKHFKDTYYDAAMKNVAKVEVIGVMGLQLLGAITFQLSPIGTLFYANFLRIRYHLSPHVRQTFAEVRGFLDKHLLPPTANPKIPAMVSKVYTFARDGIISYGQPIVRQPEPQAASQ